MDSAADLLNPTPELLLDAAVLGQALAFAFATGGTGEDFDRALNRARVSASAFHPDSFAKDLFLAEFVNRCIQVKVGSKEVAIHRGHLLRELSFPPNDPGAVPFRHGILRELTERADLRAALERTCLQINELKRILESADRGKRYDAIGRRFEILRALKVTIDLVATAFESARSGLSRAHQLGQRVKQSRGYAELCQVLDHEAHLATVDLRVRVGQDGQVRAFEIVRVDENQSNPHSVSPFRRLVARLQMLFGGYRLRQAEILGRLANHVFDGLVDGVAALFQLGLHCEFYLAALAFRDRARSAGLQVCLPEFVGADEPALRREMSVTALFNPLLLLETRPPRPCNLDMPASALVIITGPNSGGKTRLLQALGLTQLLGQAGLFVPAASARLVLRDGLFVSLNQETSADQPEGRLGMELLRIRRLFEELRYNSLVIMDELCSGTNPSEGEEIFQLVVSLLVELEPQAFITTHFLQFAERLSRERPVVGLEFLQVELDARHDPTYGFVPGVAPTSLAGRTAERLGVTREALETLVARRKRAQGPVSSRWPQRNAVPASLVTQTGAKLRDS